MKRRFEDEILNANLRSALDDMLISHGPIQSLRRKPYAYESSFPLEELNLTFANGTQLQLLFKDLNPGSLSSAARAAKPSFLDDPMREIEVYRSLQSLHSFGTARYYGSYVDTTRDSYWLFLERVRGRELYQVGEIENWKQVASWIAEIHFHFADIRSRSSSLAERLIRYDAEYYAVWLERALRFQESNTSGIAGSEPSKEILTKIAKQYPDAILELSSLPSTFIHGEFYASNIMVQSPNESNRVCAIDWERAGWGPGLIDVAALTAGKWSEQQKCEIFDEYATRLQMLNRSSASREVLIRGWYLCRLHMAIQWLGWSQDWLPPTDHQQNWLDEAIFASHQLRI